MSSTIPADNKATVLLKEFVTHYDKNADGQVDATERQEASDLAKRLDALSPGASETARVNNYVSTADLPLGQELSEEFRQALGIARDHALATGSARFADNVSRFLEIAAQPATVRANALTAAENLAATIKTHLQSLTPESIKSLMQGHYRQLRLMDGNGNWKSPELERIGQALLPENLGLGELENLVDQIAVNADENPYLHDLLEMAEAKGFDSLLAKIEEQGDEVFSSVVTYACAQNQLTSAMHGDWHVIAACETVWKAARKEEKMVKEMNLFEKLKFLGVQAPINSFLKHHEKADAAKPGKKHDVPKNFLRFLLPLNIVMANKVDEKNGFEDNVKAGETLAKHKPGGSKNPAGWSEDGEAIDVRMDEAQAWADLYEVWNLAFVSDYKHFPFVMVKLMIPEVSDYQADPEEFIYDRALALYTHLHYSMFGRIDGSLATEERVQWGSDELTAFMGEVAAQSATDYEMRVEDAENR